MGLPATVKSAVTATATATATANTTDTPTATAAATAAGHTNHTELMAPHLHHYYTTPLLF